jgi:PAS domain S-box-containing protein
MTGAGKSINILHVDDESDFLEVAKAFLERENEQFNIKCVTSAEEGLKRLKADEYDVVVSDYQMPGTDGLEFLQKIRDSGNTIPFIIFTGKGREEAAMEALNKGANHYIQKGGDIKSQYGTLAHVIQEAAEKGGAKAALQESEARYRLISENTSDLIATTTFDLDLIYTYVSPAHKKLLGYEPEDLIGKSGFDFIHPDDKKKCFPLLEKYVRAKVKEFFTKKSSDIFMSIDYRVRDTSGKWHLLESTVNIIKDELLFISRDITEQRYAENEIRKSERAYKTIFETTGTAMLMIKEDTTISMINTEFEKLTGYSKDEVEGKKSWIEFIVKEDLAKMKEYHYLRRTKPDTTPRNYAFRGILKDGSIKDVLITNGMIPGTKKSVAALLDITEQKQVEEALRESEEKYRILVENANEAIIVAQDDLLKFVNSKAVEITGYSREELNNKPFTELIHPDDRKMVIERYRKRLKGEEVSPVYPLRFIDKEGNIKWMELNAVAFSWKGNPASLKFLIDITKRKQAEEKQQEREQELQIVLDSVPISIFHIDSNSRFVQVNRALAERYGKNPEDFRGKTSKELFPEEAESFIRSDKEVVESGEPQIRTVRKISTPEGEKWVRLDKVPVKNADGEVTGIIGFELDITGRKQAEEERERFLRELEAKNAEQDRFTYTVSHDLRSPLFAIQGFASIAREDLEQGKLENLASDLERVESASKKMDRLLNDTLQLSRIGRVANPPEDVPFDKIVDGASELVAMQLNSSGVDVSTAKDFPTVHVDRVRIEELLENLIGNSIKYMGEQPSPKIEIGYRVEDEETVFFVKDNGIGIDPHLHKQVFDLFYKVNKSSTGTGAGLAIVKRIIEVHGGRIWIESENGNGCSVCFTLPIV